MMPLYDKFTQIGIEHFWWLVIKKDFWFKVCRGNKGKKFYVLSESFWKWIGNKIENSDEHGSKMRLIEKIMETTNDEIDKRAICQWVYRHNKSDARKPIVIIDDEIPKIGRNNNFCTHGYKIFCPICKISKTVDDCPVPFLWKTSRKGKIYAFDEFWRDFLDILQNCEKHGLLPSNIKKSFDIDNRVFRKWRNENVKPHIYSEKEFSFTPENLYWLGMHFSDGHIRNNGSELSFTWQSGSSNPFQGYWFPQFIQKFMHIFSHKQRRSMTYLRYSKGSDAWSFNTNLSSLSPIFMKFLENKTIIEKRKDTVTSGYSKHLPRRLAKGLIGIEPLFQGIMDGDGSYSFYENNAHINLALDPSVNYDFIEELPLVPTTARNLNIYYTSYEKNKKSTLTQINFAPSSLKYLDNKYSVHDIVDQFEFMLRSAENSVRPDKVHKLTIIIKRISSKEYGEYVSCLEIQKAIRDEVIKRNLVKFAKILEKKFPISNGFYQPFIPKWAESLSSKRVWRQEFWDFFLSGDFLEKKDYPKPKLLDFSGGVPIDFDLTQPARI